MPQAGTCLALLLQTSCSGGGSHFFWVVHGEDKRVRLERPKRHQMLAAEARHMLPVACLSCFYICRNKYWNKYSVVLSTSCVGPSTISRWPMLGYRWLVGVGLSSIGWWPMLDHQRLTVGQCWAIVDWLVANPGPWMSACGPKFRSVKNSIGTRRMLTANQCNVCNPTINNALS